MGASLYDTLQESEAQAQADQAPAPPPALRPFRQSSPSQTQPSVPRPGANAPAGTATPSSPSLLQRGLDLFRGVSQEATRDASAVGAAFLRAPGQVVGGALDTAADVGKFIGDNIDYSQVRQHPFKTGVANALATVPGLTGLGALGQAAQQINHGASLTARTTLWGTPGLLAGHRWAYNTQGREVSSTERDYQE
jgi:hypothetical protein